MADAPLDLYIAGYSDPAAAKDGFDTVTNGLAEPKKRES
jgi:hypothetical protein